MPFWLAFGIAEEFENGSGISVRVLQPGFDSVEDATGSLRDAEVPGVGGQVTAANAYVVEAETVDQAAALVREALTKRESSPQVHLARQDMPTQRRPDEPPETEVLSRLHGELCITHQLTELALSRATGNKQRERLERHKEILEDLGYAVRVMRGDKMPAGSAGQSGSERLGYSRAHVGGAESATFEGALGSLVGELSIARHQVALAQQNVSPRANELDELGRELDRFGDTVTELQYQAGSSE